MRTITIRYAEFRECPNCGGRGNDGASWRPFPCKRCEGRGRLVTTVEVEDSVRGKLPRSAYDFNARGEVFLLDFEESEEFEVVRLDAPQG
jgi:hypothetical protein